MPPSDLRIEPATGADLDRLVECWLSLAAEQRDHGSHLDVESNRSTIRDVIAAHQVADCLLVARLDDEIVGFASFAVESGTFELSVTRGTLSNLWVEPAHRDRGIGTTLLSAVESELADRGVEICQIDVMASNDSARRFYRRAGYDPHRLTVTRRLDEPGENETQSRVD
ncbi:GNAT family N-acetyltransferase [Halovivax limisalsi]|uniref:GNAT family N-acetyltransferase n=1 Tax=Halovivax limisalsi TaxID=1453760 RepID=UPI001FFDE6F7|nr:GNAT family N-acetyltransferase [Halovivax limisalsi]